MAATETMERHRSTLKEVLAAASDREAYDRRQRRARWWRRAGLALLGSIVLAALLGWLGVRYRTVTASSSGTTLSVRYPAVGRPGLGVSWQVEVIRQGGFRGDVELLVDGRYFEHFDENGVDPEPAESRSEGDYLVWTFDAPDGDRLVVNIDARISPTWQRQSSGSVAVLDEAGRPVARVEFDSWNVP